MDDSINLKVAKDCTREEILGYITNWVATAYYLGGRACIDPNELSAVTDAVIDEITDKGKPASNLRICEVNKALREGAMGSFGHYFGISGKACLDFIRAYQGSEMQKAYRKEMKIILPKAKQLPQRTQADIDRISSEGIKSVCFQIMSHQPQHEIFCDLTDKWGVEVSDSKLRQAYINEAKRLNMTKEYGILLSYGTLS